jgi:hypothetical protein
VRRREGVFAGRRGRRFLGLTSPRRAVLGFVRFVEDEAVVEFGRWNIDADFGQGEDGAVEKNVADPVAAGAGEGGRGDSVLFEDDDGIGDVRITDSAGGFEFQIASKEIAGRPA